MNRFQKEDSTLCARLNDLAGMPTTEAGIGNSDYFRQIVSQYEDMDKEDPRYKDMLPPCVVVYLKDESTGRCGFLKVHIPRYHDDIDKSLMDYIARETQGLMALMQQQNPGINLAAALEVYNTDDKEISTMFEKYFGVPCGFYEPKDA
ncbi:hypothetical protein KY361_07090 [Candidatus Woesearchaeota archaeon]|nr:hypothetical protein [Candidatus Woesearchaeota archaeon]